MALPPGVHRRLVMAPIQTLFGKRFREHLLSVGSAGK
jgi:hypothetical protein